MKRVTLLIIVVVLFIGCASKRRIITVSFRQVEKSDSVWMDKHSVDLDSMRVLIVSLQDTLVEDMNISQQNTGMGYDSPNNCPIGGHPNQSNYGYSRQRGSVEYQFFNNIMTRKVTQALKRKTPSALVESRRKVIDIKDVEDINEQFNARLVAVMRNVKFTFDSKNEYHRYHFNPDFPSWILSDVASRSFDITVLYQSVWDLFWLDASGHQVLCRQTIVQTGGYSAPTDGEPLEKVLSCALKAGDDFVSLFK